MMKDWKGVVIAEGLSDPTVINILSVYKVRITKDGIPIDYEGGVGRWHIYYVQCSREEIDELQTYILHGWYAHFWNEDQLIVVYNDKRFELDKHDKTTWKEAIEHGKAQRIPEDELEFPID
jgi:hypothetical protein